MDEEELEARRQLIEQIMEQARAGTLTTESLAELAQQTTSVGKAQKELQKVTVDVVGGLGDFTRSVAGSQGEISSMTGLVTSLGSAVGGLVSWMPGAEAGVKGLAAATNFAIGRMEASFDSFQQLSDAGLIGAEGMTGLRENMDAAGIPLETYSKMLKSNSEDLSFVFGTALKGSDQFAITMETMMDGSNDQLRTLGFTVEDVGDTVVDFQKLNRRLGYEQITDQRELAKAVTEYGSELDSLSKLTGKSKDAMQAERDAAMAETKFRAFQMTLSKEQQQVLREADAEAGRLGKEQQTKFRSVISGFVSDTLGVQAALDGTLDPILNLNKALVAGNATSEDVRQMGGEMIKASKHYVTSMGGVAMANKDAGDIGGGFASIADAATKKMLTPEEWEARRVAQKKQIDETDELTDVMVDAQTKLMRSAVDLDVLSMSHGVAVNVVATFSDTMAKATDWLRDLLGVPRPGGEVEGIRPSEQLKHEAASKVVDDTKAVATLTAKFNKALKGTDEDLIEELRTEKTNAEEELKRSTDRAVATEKYLGGDIAKNRDLKDTVKALNKSIMQDKRSATGIKQEYSTRRNRVDIDKENDYKGDEDAKGKEKARLTANETEKLGKIKARLDANTILLETKKAELLKNEIDLKWKKAKVPLEKPKEPEPFKTASSAAAEITAQLAGPGFDKRPNLTPNKPQGNEESDDGENGPTMRSQAAKLDAERKAFELEQAAITKESNKTLSDLKEELAKLGMINAQQLSLSKDQLEIIKAQLASQQEAVRNAANQSGNPGQ